MGKKDGDRETGGRVLKTSAQDRKETPGTEERPGWELRGKGALREGRW